MNTLVTNLLATEPNPLPIGETATAILLASILITFVWWAFLYR